MVLPAQEQPQDLIRDLRESLLEGEEAEVAPEVEQPALGGGEEAPGSVAGEAAAEHPEEPEEGEVALPRLQVQLPGEEVPEVQDVRPLPQRRRGRRIARPDWARVLARHSPQASAPLHPSP